MITKHLTVSGLLSKLRGVPSLLLVMLTTWMMTPSPLSINAALAAPASWDYAYKYNATADEFQFTNYAGTSTDTPAYTRTTDSTYYNYTYTGTGNDTLPFEVTLTFKRSNTTWKSVTGGYTSDDTKIGSDATVGSITNKVSILINNQTNNNYIVYLDFSNSTNYTNLQFKQNNLVTYSDLGIINNLIPIISYSFSTFEVGFFSPNINAYINAFYLKDLGVSSSYTAGYNDGEDAGYDLGYAAGYDAGYDAGYAQAMIDIEWVDEDADGYDDPSFQAGTESTAAFALGYNKGYTDGIQEAVDLETGAALNSSALMIVGLVIMFVLMLMGFLTKAKIFNLLAIAGIVFFISQFTNVAMIILGVGLIIVNLIYTFYGWNRD